MNEEMVKEAHVVIESRGWKSKVIPIKDMDGNIIKPIQLHGVYLLD